MRCFRWQVLGAEVVPDLFAEQRYCDARARALTRPAFATAAPCALWCARALESVQKASKDFVCRHAPAVLAEFGAQQQCLYAI